MGQKVNPTGIRLGITHTWDSKWFPAKGDYAKFLKLDIDIREYLRNKFQGLGVSTIELENASGVITLNLHAAKPGLIIGQQGSKIEELKEELEKEFNNKFIINVKEINKPELDSFIVAENIAKQVERRISYRRAAKAAIEKAMMNGAKGVKIKVAGRLNGVEIARSEFFTEGRVPLQTLRADIDYCHYEANTTYGIIGIKVWIYKGDVFAPTAK
jgi:small subunit ribosomal protein S3